MWTWLAGPRAVLVPAATRALTAAVVGLLLLMFHEQVYGVVVAIPGTLLHLLEQLVALVKWIVTAIGVFFAIVFVIGALGTAMRLTK